MRPRSTLLAAVALATFPAMASAQRASTATASPRRSYDFDRDWRVHVGEDAGASAAGVLSV